MLAAFITIVHLAALSEVESGDRDRAVGRDGEVTRYQVLPGVALREWRESPESRVLSPKSRALPTLPRGWERDVALATGLARGIWEKRVATFALAQGRAPSVVELYLCWHRPGRVLAPRGRELERARRFAAVVEGLTAESIKERSSQKNGVRKILTQRGMNRTTQERPTRWLGAKGRGE